MDFEAAFGSWPDQAAGARLVARWLVATGLIFTSALCIYFAGINSREAATRTLTFDEARQVEDALEKLENAQLIRRAGGVDDLDPMVEMNLEPEDLADKYRIMAPLVGEAVTLLSPMTADFEYTVNPVRHAVSFLLVALAGLFAVVGLRQVLVLLRMIESIAADISAPGKLTSYAKLASELNAKGIDIGKFFDAIRDVDDRSDGEKTASAASMPLAEALSEIARSIKHSRQP